MVLQYFDVPCVNPAGDYQCGLIGWFFGPNSPCYHNCFNCAVPARSAYDIRNLFVLYPQQAGLLVLGQSIRLDFAGSFTHIGKDAIENSIDNGSPIVTGISPDGFFRGISEHVAVIVGYEEDDEGKLTLTVNDPFPFDATVFSAQNPYIKAGGIDNGDGSYQIGYREYVTFLQWHETFYNFRRL